MKCLVVTMRCFGYYQWAKKEYVICGLKQYFKKRIITERKLPNYYKKTYVLKDKQNN